MTRVTAVNAGAFGLALLGSTAAAWLPRFTAHAPTPMGPAASAASMAPRRELVDHGGRTVPRRDYRRIVSGSSVADAVLRELCEPDRVVAVTAYSAHDRADGYRYAGKPLIERMEDIEPVLGLHPDLVFVNGIGDPRPIARLRDAGLVVYDLGEMRGMATLVPNIHEIADLLGHPERGDRFAEALVEQMNAVAAGVPVSGRRRAIYLSDYGGNLFGAAAGTSQHDVLVAAGLVDAATTYRDWPQYTPEEILVLDPAVLVTNRGMRARLCESPVLGSLRACAAPEGIVEVDGALLGDPGPSMVEAARVVRDVISGRCGPASPCP